MKRILFALAALLALAAGCTKEIDPSSVSLNTRSLSLNVGQSFRLEATIEPANATNTAVSWSSTAPEVATVDENGTVTAVGAGQAIIMVVTVAGGKSDACNVYVSKGEGPGHENPVDGVTVTPASVEVAEGLTVQLSATVSPEGASQEVRWASKDTDIATVDANGLVTGLKEGTTKVFARSVEDSEKQGECAVTVIKDPTLRGININPSEITLTVGEVFELTVIYTPSYAANKKVSWTTDNDSVASVSAEGKVTAKEEGTATVTATSEEGGFTASCKVTVGKTTGTRVYCCTNDHVLYVNGAPDPLSGAFEIVIDDVRYTFKYLKAMCADGPDLYTLEWYHNSSRSPVVLCKNRKPLIRLEEYFNDPNDVHGMAVRGGKAAFTCYSTNGTDNYVVIVSPDGTVTKSDIPGDYKNMYYLPCAFSPSGDLYIAPDFEDPFGDSHLGVYKYGTDKEWSYYDLPKHEYSGRIDISDEGDVYVFTLYQDDDYYAVLYKNGEEYSVTDQYNKYVNIDLSIAGGHIYTVALDEDEKKATERCDGNLLRTVNIDSGLHSMHATTSGDVYLATGKRIYKNDAVLFTVPGEIHYISYFCVVE